MLSRVARPGRRLLRVPTRAFHVSLRRRNEAFDFESVERATDEVDVCIVGGGPAGLSAAIRLKQLEQEKGKEIRVVVLEKGGEVGECDKAANTQCFSSLREFNIPPAPCVYSTYP